MNEKHLARFGLPTDKVVGRTYGEFHSEEDTKEFAEKIEEVFQTDKSLWHEFRSQRLGGYFLRTLSPVKEPGGRTTAVTVVTKDITARKRAEEALKESEARYRALFEGAAEGVLVADIETKEFIYANPAICRMLGYTEEELKQMGVSDINPKFVFIYFS